MVFYQKLEQTLRDANFKDRIPGWRKEEVVQKIDRPTKLGRARSLGYKAKQGFILARVRIKKGGRRRPKIRKGRVPKKSGRVHYTPSKSLQWIAEERAGRKFVNLEVLNSYLVTQDGQYKFFEVILVDRAHPVVLKKMGWLTAQRGRVFRGKTSAGRKSRGIMRGTGFEKKH